MDDPKRSHSRDGGRKVARGSSEIAIVGTVIGQYYATAAGPRWASPNICGVAGLIQIFILSRELGQGGVKSASERNCAHAVP